MLVIKSVSTSDARPVLTFKPSVLLDAEEAQGIHTMKVERLAGELVYFVSDLHLGDGSHTDIFQHKDEHFLAFLDEVEANAKTLIIVGDALDFEQAWYFSRIVRGHGKVISRLTQLAEKMRVVYVFGNHDPDIVLFRDILKWELCDKVVVDDRILAVHGYEFDDYLGDNHSEAVFWARMLFTYERLFKTWIRLPLRDYYTISNRVGHYLLYWLTRLSRLITWAGRRLDRPGLGQGFVEWTRFWGRGCLGDPMGLTHSVLAELGVNPRFDTIICGHSHLPGVVETDNNKRYINLGSWSFGNSQYGVWDGNRFLLRDWISGREFADENYRHLFGTREDWDYEDWFHDQYLGYLRFRGGEEGLRAGVRPPSWALVAAREPRSLGTERVTTIVEKPPDRADS
jgi:UDP-2,3-diacylglucosamine hydrolase